MIKDACELKECPECGSINIICNKQRNQLICRDCGVIYEPMAPEREEKFERASGLRRLGRGIRKAAGRLRRRARKGKKR
jgi:transcription initiation factor TFIIIB Brf1 subunit/transcription initiation factor TFIIB